MKTLINKVKGIFNKPDNEPSYNKEEVLQLIMIEASTFEPDLTHEKAQNFGKDIPYRGGYIFLDVDVRVEVKENYLSIYKDPRDEPEVSVHVFDFFIEIWDKHQNIVEHDIAVEEIREALLFIEIYN